MKILYNIPGTYRAAGMERVLANKANWLARHGYEVVVVTTEQQGRPSAFAMDDSIRCVDLGIGYEDNNGGSLVSKILGYPWKQICHRGKLSRLIKFEKPDVIVSMFGNDEAFVPALAKRHGAKSVLEIHFSRFKRLQYGRAGLWGMIDRWRSENDKKVAARFDDFVVLTEEDRIYWGDMPNIRVIPNACPLAFNETKVPNDPKVVLAVGRYNFQKQFDKLIDAWSLVAKECPGWSLRIVGEGEERAFLEKKIMDYGLQDRVILGRTEKDMATVYQEAAMLVVSSRYEGLPMVMIEAQKAGLPIVSFACKCGPRDIITDEEDGFLVEEGNTVELADRIFELIHDEEMRHRMGESAKLASQRFDEEKIMKQWVELFARR